VGWSLILPQSPVRLSSNPRNLRTGHLNQESEIIDGKLMDPETKFSRRTCYSLDVECPPKVHVLKAWFSGSCCRSVKGGASWEVLGHWDVPLKGIAGPNSLSPSLFPLCEVSGLLCHVFPPWGAALIKAPKQEGGLNLDLWASVNLSLYVSFAPRYIITMTESWLIQGEGGVCMYMVYKNMRCAIW
jgi:hypothetical protein